MRCYNSIGDNCLQCCLAGVVDAPLDEVVDVAKIEAYWVDSLMMWAQLEDYHVVFINEHPTCHIPYIGVVDQTVRGHHAIVFQDKLVLHDPNNKLPEGSKEILIRYAILVKKGTFNERDIEEIGGPERIFMDSKQLSKED